MAWTKSFPGLGEALALFTSRLPEPSVNRLPAVRKGSSRGFNYGFKLACVDAGCSILQMFHSSLTDCTDARFTLFTLLKKNAATNLVSVKWLPSPSPLQVRIQCETCQFPSICNTTLVSVFGARIVLFHSDTVLELWLWILFWRGEGIWRRGHSVWDDKTPCLVKTSFRRKEHTPEKGTWYHRWWHKKPKDRLDHVLVRTPPDTPVGCEVTTVWI